MREGDGTSGMLLEVNLSCCCCCCSWMEDALSTASGEELRTMIYCFGDVCGAGGWQYTQK